MLRTPFVGAFLLGAALFAGHLPASTAEEGRTVTEIPSPFTVEHTLLAQLGPEHVANAAYRRAAGGDCIVSWGDRVLEWPLATPRTQREVVPKEADWEYSNGGCALDVDGDGVDEIVVARGHGRSLAKPEVVWLKAVAGRPTWELHPIGALEVGPFAAPHDFAPLSVKLPDGTQARGVAAILRRQLLVWYRIPADPKAPWERHDIGELPVKQQSGLAVGNLAGNGRLDVVCGMFWAECPADPTREPWTIRRFGEWQDGGWGGMAQLALADMDGDGMLEIVASEAEIPNSRLGIFKRDPARPDGLWTCREIERGLYCPHSLVLADLDGDGRTDIVAGEMTAGGWDFPMNPKPRIFAYLNRGDRFERTTLVEGWGVHEMALAPRRPDGKVLVYAADEIQRHKFPEMKTHVSLWSVGR